jgi:hypothetical protein
MFSNGRPRRDRGKFRDFDPLKNLSGRFHHPVKRAKRMAQGAKNTPSCNFSDDIRSFQAEDVAVIQSNFTVDFSVVLSDQGSATPRIASDRRIR